jgi:hypothetical protein
MTLIQYLSDTGNFPGTATDISTYTLKLGVELALDDIENNFPNTQVALILFSRPNYGGEPVDGGQFSKALMPMTNDYDALKNALWYPPGTVPGQRIRPWEATAAIVPRAHGDYNGNTASYYSFMVAHNELSRATGAQAIGAGGLGRAGTDRLVIFETDGMANVGGPSLPYFNFSGPGQSYYSLNQNISGAITVSPIVSGGDPTATCMETVNRLVSLESVGGMSRPNSPVTIQCLAFGALFEAGASPPTSIVDLLQSISTAGHSVFPSTSSDPVNGYKWITGDLDTRKEKMRQAVLKAIRSTVRVALVPNTPP